MISYWVCDKFNALSFWIRADKPQVKQKQEGADKT